MVTCAHEAPIFEEGAEQNTPDTESRLWPIGPLAFAVTVSILLLASVIAFPVFGAAVVAAAGVAWWALA